jgi:hypothetical protein
LRRSAAATRRRRAGDPGGCSTPPVWSLRFGDSSCWGRRGEWSYIYKWALIGARMEANGPEVVGSRFEQQLWWAQTVTGPHVFQPGPKPDTDVVLPPRRATGMPISRCDPDGVGVAGACLGLLHCQFYYSASTLYCQTSPTPPTLLLKKLCCWGKLHCFGGVAKQVLHELLKSKFSWSSGVITTTGYTENGSLLFFPPPTPTPSLSLRSPPP